jgi:TonB family protein
MPKAPPQDERQTRLAGHIGRGTLLSFLLHGSALLPLVTLAIILGQRDEDHRRQAEQAEKEEEVDVEWQQIPADELPDDLPPVDDLTPAPRTKVAQPEPAPETEPEEVEEPPEPTPEEKVPQPPRPPEPSRTHEKIVELDMGKDVEPPPDAEFLAQKNNRAEVETRATETNLERELKGEDSASSPSDRKDENAGGAEDSIAQLQEVESKAGRRAPDVTPVREPEEGRTGARADRKSVLAMREALPRSHEVTPETADPSLPRDPNGLTTLPEQGLRSVEDLAGNEGEPKPPRLALSGQDMEYLFGAELEAERKLAEQNRSERRGRFTRHSDRVRSALENFIPEVQPGNQTALNTRAAPFAAFIAGMHRSIHPLWGWGFLGDLDSHRSFNDPLNNPDLWTRLEIVLEGDGRISNVKVVRTSGLLAFDISAVDVVHNAGPFPEPPREIRSKNGKIYVHWAFHRDHRACGTFGADYYILNNPPRDTDRGDAGAGGNDRKATPRVPGVAPRKPQKLSREMGGGRGHEGHVHPGAFAGGDDAMPFARPASDTREEDATANRRAQEARPRPEDPMAKAAAEGFFWALAHGDGARMVAVSALPFHSAGGVAAQTAAELRAQMNGLIEEAAKGRKVTALKVYSSAGLRAAVGHVPARFADDHRLLYASAIIGGEAFVAVLSPRYGGWKVVGLIR